jgi:coenzyme F420-0:L-glutamate ligase/coenzyme F420-1:gamma-L-glutamate ligase
MAELPSLEPVDICKRPATGATDDEVHGNLVMYLILINTYRTGSNIQDPTVSIILVLTHHLMLFSISTERNPYIIKSSDRTGIMETIQVMGVRGLPLIHEGDNIAFLISERISIEDQDILCIASTIYSKARGFTTSLSSIQPSERALRLAKLNGEDPRFVQAVLDSSADIILEHPFILSELSFGHIGARAGVDQSNIEDGMVIFLPPEPMSAAYEMKNEIRRITGKDVGVIITDTCGRSFRRGQTGNAIGWSGFTAIRDFRGDHDLFGHELKITEEAVVDEIAGFANFVMGESNNGVPAVIFRNCPAWTGHDDLYFKTSEDITKRLLKKEMCQ